MKKLMLIVAVLIIAVGCGREAPPQPAPQQKGIQISVPGVNITVDPEGGANVQAPGVNVQAGKGGAKVIAPGAKIEVKGNKVEVQAPDVKIEVDGKKE